MTNNNHNSITYEPLCKLLTALALDEQESKENLHETLKARGFSPKNIIKEIQTTVDTGLQMQRHSWKDEAKHKLKHMQAARNNMVTWIDRSVQEINEAFDKVINGNFGNTAQGQVQAAFRNFNKITPHDKASFLDDLEALEQLNKDKAEKNEEE